MFNPSGMFLQFTGGKILLEKLPQILKNQNCVVQLQCTMYNCTGILVGYTICMEVNMDHLKK